MEREEDKKFFERVLEANKKYYTNFKELVLLNRKNGRDHEVLCDYLECRDAELSGHNFQEGELYDYLKLHRWNYFFHDEVFSHLERKVRSRLNGIDRENNDIKRRYNLAKEKIQEWTDK